MLLHADISRPHTWKKKQLGHHLRNDNTAHMFHLPYTHFQNTCVVPGGFSIAGLNNWFGMGIN